MYGASCLSWQMNEWDLHGKRHGHNQQALLRILQTEQYLSSSLGSLLNDPPPSLLPPPLPQTSFPFYYHFVVQISSLPSSITLLPSLSDCRDIRQSVRILLYDSETNWVMIWFQLFISCCLLQSWIATHPAYVKRVRVRIIMVCCNYNSMPLKMNGNCSNRLR